MSRPTVEITRTTKETDITLSLSTDDLARDIDIPVKFLAHMLDAFAAHGRFGLRVRATGDTEVDQHHLVEDLGIVLGQAIRDLVGGGAGIERAGWCRMPMDEALADIALDCCGRGTLVERIRLRDRWTGDLDTACLREFWLGVVRESRMALHIDLVRADNDHHAIEACFKGFGRALRAALMPVESNEPISTKGAL
jgi:imidazoleglycerol-phosphate dehydratase